MLRCTEPAVIMKPSLLPKATNFFVKISKTLMKHWVIKRMKDLYFSFFAFVTMFC